MMYCDSLTHLFLLLMLELAEGTPPSIFSPLRELRVFIKGASSREEFCDLSSFLILRVSILGTTIDSFDDAESLLMDPLLFLS